MLKKKSTIITILLALVAMAGQAQTIPPDWFKTDTITIRGRIEGYDAERFGFPHALKHTEYSPMIHTQLFSSIKNENGEYERPEFLSHNKKVLENVCQSLRGMLNSGDRNSLMIQLCNYNNMQGLFPSWILFEETKADTTTAKTFRQELATNCASPDNMFPLYLATFTHPYQFF